MSKIATALKEEISRLARREINTQIRSLRKANAQYRRDIADLKRLSSALTRQVAFLEAQERKRVATAPSDASAAEGRRFSPRWLKAHRRKVGLSAADYAKLVGVSAQSVYNWERGKAKPQDQQLASLVEVRQLGKREATKRLELLEG